MKTDHANSARPTDNLSRIARTACFGILLGSLAWCPFPLGINREWSLALLFLATAGSWMAWAYWAGHTLDMQAKNFRKLKVPAIAFAITIVWVIIQTIPLPDSQWAHPLWKTTAAFLGQPLPETISIDPWKTRTEALKLCLYLSVAWMVFTITRNPDRAYKALNAVIAIGAGYAIYAIVLRLLEAQQYELFYGVRLPAAGLSGPFVQRNNFATFEGLAFLAALLRLVEIVAESIAGKDGRRKILSVLRCIFGRGFFSFSASIITFSALVATGSRAGFLAVCCALLVAGGLAIIKTRRDATTASIAVRAGCIVSLLAMLTWLSGSALHEHFFDLMDAEKTDAVRLELWNASIRMLSNAPYLGLGLGTFEAAYPMYASQTLPYIIDKAHCDFLEFAAGVGLPAAMVWWFGLLWCCGILLRGLLKRRKQTAFVILGLAATTLVIVHSAVDFSLQIPAVAMLYAVLVGVSLAQSFSIRE